MSDISKRTFVPETKTKTGSQMKKKSVDELSDEYGRGRQTKETFNRESEVAGVLMGRRVVIVWRKYQKHCSGPSEAEQSAEKTKIKEKMVSVVDNGFANGTRLRSVVFLG